MQEIWRKKAENIQENEGIRKYMLPYAWALGLGKITDFPAGRGGW